MGWGDELMAAGQAHARRASDPAQRRVRILDRDKRPRWHPLWEGNIDLVKPGEFGDFLNIVNGPGARPYIAAKSPERWAWRPFQPTPAPLKFTAAEKAFAQRAAPSIVVEPTLKLKASPNKQWPLDCWQAFAELARAAGLELVQLGQPTFVLPGARVIATPDFRHAAAVIGQAEAYVGHEGGLHHAAAAVHTPAVVLFGGFISPQQTGYDTHRNLFTGGEPCGSRLPCAHCAAAMAAITPERVLAELLNLLEPSLAHH